MRHLARPLLPGICLLLALSGAALSGGAFSGVALSAEDKSTAGVEESAPVGWSASPALARPTPERVGAWLDAPPPIPPGGLAHAPPPSLDGAVRHHLEGDPRRAIVELEGWLASGDGPWGRERASGRFLLGWLYLHQGRYNLASAEFTAVRSARGPLEAYASWFEALTDHKRGRHTVAARECASYRERFPEGPHADECLVLMGDAYVAAGLRTPAISAYTEFLEKNPDSPRGEELRLGIALAEVNANPARGARLLADLALSHEAHCNGEAAQRALEALTASGAAQAPEIDPMLAEQLRAITLRECGYIDEAWESFNHIRADHADDASAWIAANQERFAWRTKQFSLLGDSFASSYAQTPSPETAWYAYRAYFRAGSWQKAADWAELGLKEHPSHYRFRSGLDMIAHTNQLAGRYTRAREHWDTLGKTGGSLGRAARWFGAFASVRAEDWPEAIKRLDEQVDGGGEYSLGARYYRGRARWATGDKDGAREDWREVQRLEPGSWYSLMLQSRWRELPEAPDPVAFRQGRWDGPPLPAMPEPPAPTPVSAPPMARVDADLSGPRAALVDGRSWPAWVPAELSLTADDALEDPDAIELTEKAPAAEGATPAPSPAPATEPSYAAGRFYDPVAAERAFYRFAEEHEDLWPQAPALHDLATVGLYEITGPAFANLYEEWADASARRTPRQAALRSKVQYDRSSWRQLFLFVHDHHHVARFSMGLDRYGADAEEARAALRLAFPAVEIDQLARWGRTFDLDPLLALGLMRQESLYRDTALSHVGATGLMQIMPGTGAKVADLLNEPSYTPAVLEIPEINLRYGTYYLSRLLTRFEGGWPMAVAAYNAGPVNVSSWYQGWQGRIQMDDWVEQIPLKETRNYVMRVAEFYAVYVELYGPEGAVVHVPTRPAADDREVINF